MSRVGDGTPSATSCSSTCTGPSDCRPASVAVVAVKLAPATAVVGGGGAARPSVRVLRGVAAPGAVDKGHAGLAERDAAPLDGGGGGGASGNSVLQPEVGPSGVAAAPADAAAVTEAETASAVPPALTRASAGAAGKGSAAGRAAGFSGWPDGDRDG